MTEMICPICKHNGVPFSSVWIRSGWGRFNCRDCGATLKVRKDARLPLLSALLACSAFILGISTKSWIVFSAAVIIVIFLDALIDYRFRVLISAGNE